MQANDSKSTEATIRSTIQIVGTGQRESILQDVCVLSSIYQLCVNIVSFPLKGGEGTTESSFDSRSLPQEVKDRS